MPNWNRNNIAIRGKKENILAFVNEGLKNSGRNTYSDVNDLESAVNDLAENAKGLDYSTSQSADNRTKGLLEEVWNRGLYMGTFRPMPDIFRYDTTNHKDMFPEQANEQAEKYGAIGWYNYNCNVRFGCKWDAGIENFRYLDFDDEAVIEWYCETAWIYPICFLRWIRDTFNVAVFIMTIEESEEYAFYGEIDDEQCGQSYNDACPYDEEKAALDDDYDDEYDADRDEYYENMYINFKELVEEYDIDR